jgi:hypothetical protein
MSARNEHSAAKRLRGWWVTPPRSGIERFIAPPEYRHLRGFGITRVVAGAFAVAAGFVCLAYAAYGWAAFFLVVAALSLAAGCWELTIARSR